MSGFDPNHFYYSPDGQKITLDEWSTRFESGNRTLRETAVLPDTRVKTMYMGFVDLRTPGARLYATALIIGSTVTEIEAYDSRQEALDGHARHIAAIQVGYHCDRCRDGEPHID